MILVRRLLIVFACLIAGLLVEPSVTALQNRRPASVKPPTTKVEHFGPGLGIIFKPSQSPPSLKPPAPKPKPLPVVTEPLLAIKPTADLILPPIFHDTSVPPVKDGLAPVIIKLPTSQKVVFLGIDDGGNKTQSEIDLLAQQHIHASLFLADLFVGNRADFFNGFIPSGSLIENHTLNHRQMSHLSYGEQVQEICGEADLELQQFGRRPVLFRPPFGDYNKNTQRAAATCGMQAVVLWVAKANGGSMQYQVGDRLRPGDIVLMHFRPEFSADLKAFVEAQTAAGLHTELLEDWLPGS